MYVRLSCTRQRGAHYIHNYIERISTNYKIYNMKQVNQKAISAKLDMEVFAEMELYCKVKDIKRNRLINLALTEYMTNHNV